MNQKSLKVKIFLNMFGTYEEVCQVSDITTAPSGTSMMVRFWENS